MVKAKRNTRGWKIGIAVGMALLAAVTAISIFVVKRRECQI